MTGLDAVEPFALAHCNRHPGPGTPLPRHAKLPRVTAIAQLEENRTVEGIYAVARKERLRTRNGATYLALELVDPSGRIGARVWNDVEMLDGRFERGRRGARARTRRAVPRTSSSSTCGRSSRRRASTRPGWRPALRRDADELEGFLEFLLAEMHDTRLRGVVSRALTRRRRCAPIRRRPTATTRYAGGLLEHTVGVATLCRETAQIHPRLRADLLVAAALVHDVGRTRELGAAAGLRADGGGPPARPRPSRPAAARGTLGARPGVRQSSCTRSPATTTRAPPEPPRRPCSTTRTSSTRSRRRDPCPTRSTRLGLCVPGARRQPQLGRRGLPRRRQGARSSRADGAGRVAAVRSRRARGSASPPAEADPWRRGGLVRRSLRSSARSGSSPSTAGMAAGAISVVGADRGGRSGSAGDLGRRGSGDQISGLQAIGFVAAVGGSVAASLERGPDSGQLAAGVGWAAVAMLAFGAYYVPMHAASTQDWLWPRFPLPLHVGDARLVDRARPPRLAAWLRPHWLGLVAIGVLDTGGNALFAAASSTHGLLSVVSVLASLYPVVTVLLARLVLGERVAADAGCRRRRGARRRRPDHSGRPATLFSITERSSRTSSRQSPRGRAGSSLRTPCRAAPGRRRRSPSSPRGPPHSTSSRSQSPSACGRRRRSRPPQRFDDRLVQLGRGLRAGRPRLAAAPLVGHLRDLRATRRSRRRRRAPSPSSAEPFAAHARRRARAGYDAMSRDGRLGRAPALAQHLEATSSIMLVGVERRERM